ncbi:hypothetical protein [Tautonia plasticadhaerens]|uniref:Uncharacterized protein n=1 Tax=Tautonia plasticadhaerens TaxID=2527974 RepID=A0A518HDM0_9BACT|nr:hypothetical protein [Tautonia plasticadhaerens]QDV38952.1 hypothetical protein ElP_69120 [Tautonia plasticadhaerens]
MIPKIPAPRPGLRGLVLITLLVGLALGVDGMATRHAECLERADRHGIEADRLEREVRRLVEYREEVGRRTRMIFDGRAPMGCPPRGPGLELIGRRADRAAWHRRRSDHYLRAASRPWAAIPPESTGEGVEPEGDGPPS